MPTIRKGLTIASKLPEMSPEETAAIDRRLPNKLAYAGKEHSFQVALFSEMKLRSGAEPRLHLLFAVPNAARRGHALAAAMKAEGLKAGVPDVCLPVPSKGRHGMWLELKARDNKPTPEQLQWLLDLHRQGYAAHLVNDMATARNLILSYLAP